jgi:sucrose-6-phosphate hydrolase SacC (GH32 family)
MYWKRLGKIFDPKDFKLLEGQCGYAQSPQAVVFDAYIRIFFSTRVRDHKGVFVSHVAYVDFDRDLKKVIGHSQGPVIALGKLGTFDEHGIFPMNVLRVDEKFYAFTTGWTRRKSVAVDAAIGLAVSSDGATTFQKIGDGPVLGPSLNQPFLVGDAFVAQFGREFHMWYIHGTRWIDSSVGGQPERVYKISHATSRDCMSWAIQGQQIVPDRLGADECQALPTVIQFNNRYHMWFCYRHATDFRNNLERSYRIGYAYSSDLQNWTRDDAQAGIEVAHEGWDSEMLCYPNVFHCDGKVLMLYNGNEFGRHGFGLAELVH